MTQIAVDIAIKGGQGSGNFDHAGRPGKVGGSAAQSGISQKRQEFLDEIGENGIEHRYEKVMIDRYQILKDAIARGEDTEAIRKNIESGEEILRMHREWQRDVFLRHFGGEESRVQFKDVQADPNLSDKENAALIGQTEDVREFLSQILPGWTYVKPKIVISSEKRRAAFSWGEITIGANKATFDRTLTHELGHHLDNYAEIENGSIRKEVMKFFSRRTEGETPQPLGERYGSTEYTLRDKFIKPYIGKVKFTGGKYQKNGEEVLSMGLQYLYIAPAKFAAEDPDMFDFVVSTIKKIKRKG